MNEEIIIDGDLPVTIIKIMQWRTYTWLIEGIPTIKWNQGYLTGALEKAKEFCCHEKIHLIEPEQTPISHGDGYFLGSKTAALPRITCIAEVKYHTVFRNKAADYSLLGLVWYQEDYAFPIDKDVLEKIKEIPFREICGEFEH